MRDWSSDVCSSDLGQGPQANPVHLTGPELALGEQVVLAVRGQEITLDGGGDGLFDLGVCRGSLACGEPAQRATVDGLEWWQRTERGVEQGWVIQEGGDSVSKEIQVSGALVLPHSANEAMLLNASGAPLIRVHGVAAWDASGRALPAGLRVQGQSMHVHADTRGAVWPVTLDPFYSTPDEEILGGYTSDMDYGARVMPAGDLNGDGYDEMVVSADVYGDRGYYWLYLGSAAGPSATHDLLIEGTMANLSHQGRLVPGDINGDGYGDLVLRQRDLDGTLTLLRVFLGSASGISSAPDALITRDSTSFDTSARDIALCDVDGDGYDDVVAVGNSDLAVFAGSSSGLSTSFTSHTTALGLGVDSSLSCAGDVNGDGTQDVVLGSYDDAQVVLFLGASTGLASSASWTQSSSSGVPKYGSQVLGVGDVDGDGYDDFAVGHKAYGYVELFLGSSSGPGTSPDQTYVGSLAGHTQVIAAPGDVDGDGVDDLALLEPKYGVYGSSALGRVTVHLGASTAPSSTADMSYEGDPSVGIGALGAIGDVDGDGYADLGIGQSEEMAGVLLGSSSLSVDLSWEPDDWYDGMGYGLAADDWDGDGYDDLAYALGESGVGLSWGAASGVATTPDDVLSTSAVGFGYKPTLLHSPGDVDGDGYPELVVFANGDNQAVLFYGGASGLDGSSDTLSATHSYTDTRRVASGDLNGDGYADLAFNAGGSSGGSVLVHLGDSAGIDTTSAWGLSGTTSSQDVGRGLAILDVDGDGYDDLVLNSVISTSSLSSGVHLFWGGAGGLSSTPDQTLSPGVRVYELVSVGDVNGDGFEDVLAGSPAADTELILGSATGLQSPIAGPTAETGVRFGSAFALGDVDGDGYDDVGLSLQYTAELQLYLGGSVSVSTSMDRSYDLDLNSPIGAVSTGMDWNGDGYLDMAVAVEAEDGVRGRISLFPGELDGDGDGWVDSEDCDPADASVSMLSWYADSDADGYGDPDTVELSCTAPSGYVADDTDCDDTNALVSPAGTEVCDSADVDEDCDGLVNDDDSGVTGTSTWYLDGDSDGYGLDSTTLDQCERPSGYVADGGDCDDADGNISPGDAEICDASGVDEDCDGLVNDADADVTGTSYSFLDADGDGYGDSSKTSHVCDLSSGYVWEGGDCDDRDAAINPGALEVCDASDVDEDCDGFADDRDSAPTGTTAWYPDTDGDGYGREEDVAWSCESYGLIATGGDCDDGEPAVNPGAVELCDAGEVDEDCDGAVNDESAVDRPSWFPDADGDGYGDPSLEVLSCSAPSGHVADFGDCDDARDDVHPGAKEVCDGGLSDEDCDGLVGNDDAVGADGVLPFYVDGDGDGFGDPDAQVYLCEASEGVVEDDSDCDDARADVNPDGVEICDAENTDEDCDLQADDQDPEGAAGTTLVYLDQDGDGVSGSVEAELCDLGESWLDVAGNDCNDADETIYPGAEELLNDGIDQDCDGNDLVRRGCSTGSTLPSGMWALLGLVLLGRRRRDSLA